MNLATNKPTDADADIDAQETARESYKDFLASSDHVPFRAADQAVAFILAGKARVTFRSTVTGQRFTYKVVVKGSVAFVSVLTGPDNSASYTYLGTIFGGTTYRHGRKSPIGQAAPSARAFAWAFGHLSSGRLPATLEVHHEGTCGRCGRALTVPESVISGFGPECAKRGEQ